MAKKCLHKDCKYNQFGGGYCIVHQFLRKDKKKNKPQNRTPIPKTSKRQRVRLGERKKLFEKDKEFYSEIWDERPHVCFETGVYLGEEPLTLYFHHVLEKGIERFSKYRHKKWNIVLLSWEAHDQVRSNIDLTPKVKAYTQKLLKKYDK